MIVDYFDVMFALRDTRAMLLRTRAALRLFTDPTGPARGEVADAWTAGESFRYCGYCHAKSAWNVKELSHHENCAFVVARGLLGIELPTIMSKTLEALDRVVVAANRQCDARRSREWHDAAEATNSAVLDLRMALEKYASDGAPQGEPWSRATQNNNNVKEGS